MKDELIKALKALTIGQAEETFHSDYDSFDDEASDKIKAREDLDAYCKGVNDVLKILENLDVVERSKIDEVIKGIIARSYTSYEDIQVIDLKDALEILKRNIA